MIQCITIIILIAYSKSLIYHLDPKLLFTDITFEELSPFQNLPYYLPTLRLCIGTPNNQCFNLAISTASQFIMVEHIEKTNPECSSQFIPKQSSSLVITGMSLGVKLFQPHFVLVHIFNDFITLPNQDIPIIKHTFVTLQSTLDIKGKIDIDGLLGMQKHYSAKDSFDGIDYSFLYYLYNKTHQIPRPNFALSYNEDGSGILYLGEDLGDYGKCRDKNQFKNFPLWNCDLDHVEMNNEIIKMTKGSSVFFNSVSSIVIAPFQIGIEILNRIVVQSNEICSLGHNMYYRHLKCLEVGIDVNTFPDIVLKMNDFRLVLQWKYMFKTRTNDRGIKELISVFVAENYEKEDGNHWKIGVPGFIDNLIAFDRNDKSVGVLSKGWRMNKGFQYMSIAIIITNGISIIMILGIVLLVITRNKV